MLLRYRIGILGGLTLAASLLGACSGGGSSSPARTATPSPSPTGSPTPGPVTISDGGSTNRKAFSIVINFDDTTTVTQDGATRNATPTASSVSQLYNDILANVPLSNVATLNGCTKSASYGSTTSLTYAGSSTQDISCPPSTTSPAQTLFNDVEAIESEVGPFNN